MITQKAYDNGIRCRGICSLCNERIGCIQYIAERSISKPPLGLTPKDIWIKQRLQEIKDAISRYLEADYIVPNEWFDEYSELGKLIKEDE